MLILISNEEIKHNKTLICKNLNAFVTKLRYDWTTNNVTFFFSLALKVYFKIK